MGREAQDGDRWYRVTLRGVMRAASAKDAENIVLDGIEMHDEEFRAIEVVPSWEVVGEKDEGVELP